MINPIANAYNAFLGFLSCIPQPIAAFLFLCLGTYIIIALVRLIFS